MPRNNGIAVYVSEEIIVIGCFEYKIRYLKESAEDDEILYVLKDIRDILHRDCKSKFNGNKYDRVRVLVDRAYPTSRGITVADITNPNTKLISREDKMEMVDDVDTHVFGCDKCKPQIHVPTHQSADSDSSDDDSPDDPDNSPDNSPDNDLDPDIYDRDDNDDNSRGNTNRDDSDDDVLKDLGIRTKRAKTEAPADVDDIIDLTYSCIAYENGVSCADVALGTTPFCHRHTNAQLIDGDYLWFED